MTLDLSDVWLLPGGLCCVPFHVPPPGAISGPSPHSHVCRGPWRGPQRRKPALYAEGRGQRQDQCGQ